MNDAINFLDQTQFPLVVKADGLASGKGVYICEEKNSANIALKEIFNGKFGLAKNVLIEEFLNGEEMSYFIISDGKEIKSFETAQDHKRALEGDKGPNTGGMGAYSPSRLINTILEEKILNKIIKPTIKALRKMGSNYKGFLYAGLMIVNDEPYLIEYNVRMGDPECQTILPKLKTDLLEIIDACCNEKLKNLNIEWHNKKSLCVVLCSKGYPDKYHNNILIENIENLNLSKHDFIYHAGTKKIENKIYSNGGRVISFVSLTSNFKESRNKIFNHINKLNWMGGFFRKDIGYKVLTRPLKDLTKESMFNIIKHSKLLNVNIENSDILDLFSGVGSFGLECLSRGAKNVTFLESYKDVLTILKKNIHNMKQQDYTTIIERDIFEPSTLKVLDEKFDIIFMDPPYKEKKLAALLNTIIELKLLKSNGVIIIHRHKKEEDILPKKFNLITKKNYGISKIIFGTTLD